MTNPYEAYAQFVKRDLAKTPVGYRSELAIGIALLPVLVMSAFNPPLWLAQSYAVVIAVTTLPMVAISRWLRLWDFLAKERADTGGKSE